MRRSLRRVRHATILKTHEDGLAECPSSSAGAPCVSGDDGTPAGQPLAVRVACYALPSGTATNCVALPDFTRIKMSCLPCALACCSALAHVAGIGTGLPPTSRMTLPVWKPARPPARRDRRRHHDAVLSGALQRRPRAPPSDRDAARPLAALLLHILALACCCCGMRPSVTDTVRESPSRSTSSLTEVSGASVAICACEIAGVLHARAVDRGDDVARLQPGLGGRAAGLGTVDDGAFDLLHAEAVGDAGADRLDLHAEIAARHLAVLFQLGDDHLGGLRRNIETDADRSARRRVDRSVDADYVAVDVERRPAGIALVDRRVDLNEIVIGARRRCRGSPPTRCRPSRCRRIRTDCRPRSPNRRPAAHDRQISRKENRSCRRP